MSWNEKWLIFGVVMGIIGALVGGFYLCREGGALDMREPLVREVARQPAPQAVVQREMAHGPQASMEFSVHAGFISGDGDLHTETMTISAAKQKCAELPGCKGFCHRGPATVHAVEIYFKNKWDNNVGEWTSFKVEADLEAQPPKAMAVTNSGADRSAQPEAGLDAALGSAFNTAGRCAGEDSHADAFPVGAIVETHSLKTAALNGARGKVVGFQEERVRVELPGGEKALMPMNLKLVKAAGDARLGSVSATAAAQRHHGSAMGMQMQATTAVAVPMAAFTPDIPLAVVVPMEQHTK